jgi:hypothetical protein
MANGYSLQSLGNGAYRVSGIRVNPTTGKYVTRSSAGSEAKPAPSAESKQPKRK